MSGPAVRRCRACGKRLKGKRADARYCGDACRQYGHRHQLEFVVARILGQSVRPESKCLVCDKPIAEGRRRDVLYCSIACKQRAARHRKRRRATGAANPR